MKLEKSRQRCLSDFVREENNFDNFKRLFKTFYFIGAYSDLALVIKSSFIVSFFCYFYLLIISHARVHIACVSRFVIFLDFHSTKQGLPLVDSWSRGLD